MSMSHFRLRAFGGALIALLALAVAPATAAADRAFAPRFQANDTGAIVGIGNTLMTCPASANGCNAARSHGPTTTANSQLNNDNWDMRHVDVDDVAGTFSSSQATLALPSGAQVLWAGLYWGGDSSGAPNAAARDTVKLRAPGASSYGTITGSVDSADVGTTRYFQGFADVTSAVASAGAGVYTVADVQSGTGSKHFAGWSLIVVYRDTSEPARNLTVFDGLRVIRSSDPPTTIDVSGFRTPPSGVVKTELGLVTYEGDLGIVGDTASLNGTPLHDAQHPQTNYFDSSLSRRGVPMPGRTPSYANQLGFDITYQDADGLLANDATSAAIRVTTSGDQYVPGVITFATELHAPRIEQAKTVVDANGGELVPGDTLVYTIKGRNAGLDGATGFTLGDPIPAGTTYVPGSLQVVDGAGAPAGPQTDAPGDDLGEIAGGALAVRLGTGASSAAGGRIAPGGTYEVRFAVTVDGGVATGTTITNTVTARLTAETLGTPLTAVSDAKVTVTGSVPATADVRLEKSASDLHPRAGDVVTYTLKATNDGPGTAKDVTITDPLPPGVTFLSASAPCTASGGIVSCPVGDLAKGASRTVTIKVTADPLPGGGGPADVPEASHLIGVEKVERQVDLEAGDSATIALECPQAGQILTDGSVRTDAVDQGTGTPGDVRVLRAAGTSKGAWEAVVRNDASGRAQAKAFAVCIAGTTGEAAGHRHDLVVSDPVTATRSWAPGTREVALDCPAGSTAIVPGWSFEGGDARVTASEPTATGWRFTVDVEAATEATLSLRCLDDHVAAVDGHTHALQLDHLVEEITVPAGQIVEGQVTCADDAKGIVASWDLPAGVISLGNDPRPKTRAFRLQNTGASDAKAKIDLTCLGDRTGPGQAVGAGPRTVVNTAEVASPTPDPDAANNRAGATIEVRGAGAVLTAAPVVVTKRRAAVRMACPTGRKACRGTLKVVSKGAVAAKRRVSVGAGRTKTVRVALRRALGAKARLSLRAGGRTHVRVVRVRR